MLYKPIQYPESRALDRITLQQPKSHLLPEIQMNQQFKSLQNIPHSSRVNDGLLSYRNSLFDQIQEPLTQRSTYNSIIKNKKFSLNQEQQSQKKGLLVKFEDMGIQNNQPKSILKRKNSNSSQHSDVLDFFELVEEQALPVRNKKHIILEPLQSTPSPQMANAISPKRVSFNKQIQIKLISDDYTESNEKRVQSRHHLRRQMTDFIN
ncbi:unnamed protein product (macronuclear) [Paramecium tetraurelia]|uniref:Uncharacterized protein n=1 Tax=Paramecium tetraurelia TaxID=5888 RepID=A0BN70_PARTE|nr:uncharacterized protein GSPATT00030625001 [Paramecium tetraurelia]CAK59987.1 unnamed protein product [Paramecium tetraurelia]|eukprot:XP_001427385.1 hypothetical protein (macronuclear) [Paramecium tetraurelia strain d4-2]